MKGFKFLQFGGVAGLRDRLKAKFKGVSPRGTKKVAFYLYIAHLVTILAAFGFVLCACFAHLAEDDSVGKFDFNITKSIWQIYYWTAALLFIAAIVGLIALCKGNKPSLWIVYSMILGVMGIVEISVGFSAIGKGTAIVETLNKSIRGEIVDYPTYAQSNTSEQKIKNIKDATDTMQEKFECCGVDGYMDWQDVQFGRTSLRLPVSCCLEKLRHDQYCGINLLPEHENASRLINTDGCIEKVASAIKRTLLAMGVYGLIISIAQLILVGTASYLMMTKKI